MANRFFRNNTPNWNDTANWSLTSGGSGGLSIPVAGDIVYFDANSGNCNLNVNAFCRALIQTGYTGTFTHTAGVSLSIGDATAGPGNVALVMSASMFYILGNAVSSSISFVSTSATVQTINYAGKITGNVFYNGVGGSYQLISNHTTDPLSTIRFVVGTLNTNGFTVNAGRFESIASGTRVLTLGSSVFNLTGVSNECFIFSNVTGLTITANTAIIKCYGSATTTSPKFLSVGNNTDWKFSLEFYGGGSYIIDSGNNVGFNNVRAETPPYVLNGIPADSLRFNNKIVLTGTLYVLGSGSQRRLKLYSLVSNQISKSTVIQAQYADFQNVQSLGPATDLSNSLGGAGDLGGNSGIIFTTPLTIYYYTPTTGVKNWSDSARWFNGTGGTGGLSRIPLPVDTVIFNAASFPVTGCSVYMDRATFGRNITFLNVINNPNLHFLVDTIVTGNLEYGANMTLSAVDGIRWISFIGQKIGAQTYTYKTSGLTTPHQLTLSNMLIITDTLSIIGNFSSVGGIYVAHSIFQSNNNNFDIHSFHQTTSSAVNLGTGIWTINGIVGVLATPVWNYVAGTVNASTSLIILHNTTPATTQTFAGGGKIYNDITFSGDVNNTYIITGDNTFNVIYNLKNSAYTIKFAGGSITAVTNFNIQGSVGKEITLTSTNTTSFTLNDTVRNMYNLYLIISYSNGLGGATWYAILSTDGGNNTGWIFLTGLIKYHKGGVISDINNWSYFDGGAGGVPLPVIGDEAIFPASSPTDPIFDINLVVNIFRYNTTRPASGTGSITVYNLFSVTTDTVWSMISNLILKGDISITSPTSFNYNMPVFIEGYNSIISGVTALNKATNSLVNINKYIGYTLTLGSDCYFNKSPSQNTTLDNGIIDHSIYKMYVGDSFIQNGGEVIGDSPGFMQAQKIILNGGKFDPYEAFSITTQNTIAFQDSALVDLLPSGGKMTFSGVNEWTINQNFTEFNDVDIDKGPSSTQFGIIYVNGNLNILNNSKYGSFNLNGDFNGASNSVTGNQYFDGIVDQAINFLGQMNVFVINKATGTININTGIIKVAGINNISGGDRIDLSSTIVHIYYPAGNLNIWNVLGMIFGTLKIEISSTGSGDLSDTVVTGDFIIDQIDQLNGTPTLKGNLIINDPAVAGTGILSFEDNALQNITSVASGGFTPRIIINKTGGEVKLLSTFINTDLTSLGIILTSGVFNANGFSFGTSTILRISTNSLLKLKGNEIITVDGLPSRGNVNFDIQTGSFIEYYDPAVVAVVNTLSDLVYNLILGAGKIHEFVPGAINQIEVAGIFSSNGTTGILSVMRTLGNGTDQWYIKLSGVSLLGIRTAVNHGDANAGIRIDVFGSVDMGDNENWYFNEFTFFVPDNIDQVMLSDDTDLLRNIEWELD